MQLVNVLVEGLVDEAVAVRLLNECNLKTGAIYGKRGAGFIRTKADALYKSRTNALLTLVDFVDTGADCVAKVPREWVRSADTNGLFRVVVREVESWLLADREAIADFLAVRLAHVPSLPEMEADPKQAMVSLARRSRRRSVRDAMVPEQGMSGVQGKLYTSTLVEFVHELWRPGEAAKNAPSLERCLSRLSSA